MRVRLADGSGFRDLKFLHEDRDRYGTVRIYFRRGAGSPKVRIRSEIGTAEFIVEYEAAFLGIALPTPAAPQAPRRPIISPAQRGTVRWLVAEYCARSISFIQSDARSQRVRRNMLEAVCMEPVNEQKPDGAKVGDRPISSIVRADIVALRDRKVRAGVMEAANNRLKALRVLWRFAIEEGLAQENPTALVPYIRTGSQGHHAWTPDEVRMFFSRHPVGTKGHLAVALLLYLGCRRADVVELGRQHIRAATDMPADLRDVHDGPWLQYTQHKNRKKNPVSLTLPILPELHAAIEAGPTGNMTFLISEWGRPFTANGFGAWMHKRCIEAGIPHCSAHGLRKAGSTMAAENGATPHQLMSIFGWRTLKEAERYTRSARQMRLAASAMPMVAGRIANKKSPL